MSPGFDVRHTLRVQITLSPVRYSNVRQKKNYLDSSLRQLGALAGIESVAAARLTPFNGNAMFGSTLKFPDNGQQVHSEFKWNAVTPAYFQAMDIPLYLGRDFSTADERQKVVIVNRTFVRRYLAIDNPLEPFSVGERMTKSFIE